MDNHHAKQFERVDLLVKAICAPSDAYLVLKYGALVERKQERPSSQYRLSVRVLSRVFEG